MIVVFDHSVFVLDTNGLHGHFTTSAWPYTADYNTGHAVASNKLISLDVIHWLHSGRDGIRTRDLLVMSQASYLCSTLLSLPLDASVRGF
jgi:hypothetical protein